MKITEADRENARLERERGHSKMSETAKQRLRQQTEADQKNEVAEAQVCAQFQRLTKNLPNMMNAICQVWKCGEIPNLERMAAKLLACIQSSLRPTCSHDIVFLMTLTPQEERMSDKRFEAELQIHSSIKHKAKAVMPTEHRCALGKKCVHAVRRQPALVTGGGIYCSKVCRGRAAVLRTDQTPEVASGTRMDTGENEGQNRESRP